MILVTGATGFVGYFVTRELARRGVEFRGLARGAERDSSAFPVVHGDLNDPASLREARRSASGLIHLASTLSNDPLAVLDTDVKGFLALLDGWDAGPVVLASTMDVYPADPSGPVSEDTSPDPPGWYGLGKLICEKSLRMASAARRFPWLVLRIPYVIGVHPRAGGSAFGRLVGQILAGHDVVVPGLESGTSWVAAEELARGIVSAVNSPVDGIYNIASGWTTWRDAAGQLARDTGSRSRILVAAGGSGASGGRRLDTRSLQETFGIDPRRSLREELLGLAAYLRGS